MYLDSMNVAVGQICYHKRIVLIPESVTIEIKNDSILIKGQLGTLIYKLHRFVNAQLNNLRYLSIYSNSASVSNKALIGTTQSLIKNMIIGVTLGFIKKLQLVGIGYRAQINEDNVINLIIGLSHSVNYVLPVGIKAQCLNSTEIILTGIDKQLVGQVAANLRGIKPPEPFKGKGIRYTDEHIRTKETKKR